MVIGYVRTERDDQDKTAYHCAFCGIFITHSGALVKLNGSDRHSFTNPVGIQCNFRTFSTCENVMVHEDLYLEHSWFPEYGWRFLTCGNCGRHLGWKYDLVRKKSGMSSFFGILIEATEQLK